MRKVITVSTSEDGNTIQSICERHMQCYNIASLRVKALPMQRKSPVSVSSYLCYRLTCHASPIRHCNVVLYLCHDFSSMEFVGQCVFCVLAICAPPASECDGRRSNDVINNGYTAFKMDILNNYAE
jgi:hypothetical protein